MCKMINYVTNVLITWDIRVPDIQLKLGALFPTKEKRSNIHNKTKSIGK